MEKKRTDGGVSIQVDRDVNDRFERYCTTTIRVKRLTVTRILDRFLKQPEIVQKAMLGDVTAEMAIKYAEALEALAHELREQARMKLPTGSAGRGVKDRKASLREGRIQYTE